MAWKKMVQPNGKKILRICNVTYTQTPHDSTSRGKNATNYEMAGSQKQTRKENRASNQGIFQDLEHGGCQPTVGGPFLSLLLSPSLSSPFSSPLSLLSPEAGEGCCAKVGGINPPEGVWETPWRRTTTATVVPDTIIGQQSTHGSNFIRRTDTRLISSYTNKSRQRMPIFAEFIERSCLSASCSHWCAEVQCG